MTMRFLPFFSLFFFFYTSNYAQDLFHSRVGLSATKILQIKTILDEDNQVNEVFYTAQSANLLTVIRLDMEGTVLKEFTLDLSQGIDQTRTGAYFNAQYKLDQIVFNGDAFGLVVSTNQTKVFLSYDIDGQLLGVMPILLPYSDSKSAALSRWNHIRIVASTYDQTYIALLENTKIRSTFEIQKLDKYLQPMWERPFLLEESKFKYNSVLSLDIAYDRIFFINLAKQAQKSKATAPKLYSLDAASGEALFKFPLFHDGSTLIPSKIHIDPEENIVLSGDYFQGNKMKKITSSGIFLIKLDPTGNPIIINKDSWERDIQKQMKHANGMQIAKTKPFFHDITVKEDGGYQVIAETFSTEGAKRTMALLGTMAEIAGAAAGIEELQNAGTIVNTTAQLLSINPSAKVIGYPSMPNEAPRTIKVKNLLVFDYDDQGNLLEVRLIKKPKTSIQSYYSGYQGLTLAKLINQYGYFDYQFFMGSGDDRKLIYYKDGENKAELGLASITTGEEIKNQTLVLTGVEGKAQKGQVGFVKLDEENLLYFHFYIENKSTKLDIFKQSTVIEL